MTMTTTDHVEHLDEAECWHRLLGAQVGRLAFDGRQAVGIVPLNYVVRGHSLLFRTVSDADLLTPQRRPVAFEIDGWSSRNAWSVVAQGELNPDPDPDVLAREAEIGLAPWAPDDRGPRSTVVELIVHTISGRSFPRHPRSDALWYW